MPQSNPLRAGLRSHFSEAQLNALAQAKTGIAGVGGIGSNVAMLLARCGIGNMVLIDHDIVEASNLNRQHFWPGQLGLPKVVALAGHLRELNPDINIEHHVLRLAPDNLPQFIPQCPIWIEALDEPQSKAMFVEQALLHERFTVAVSGLAGFGGPPLAIRRMGNLALVGDFQTRISAQNPPLAPRVTQAAALMADIALEHVLLNV